MNRRSPQPDPLPAPQAGWRPLLRDTTARLLYATGLTRPAVAGAGSFTVVTFHRVLTESQLAQYPLPGIAVTTDEFAWFVDFFSRHYTCGTLAEMFDRGARGERFARPPLAITFDDGQLDNFLNARPLLARAGLRATFFVVAGMIDSGTPLWHDRIAYGVQRLYETAPADLRTRLDPLGLDPNRPVSAAAAVEAAKGLSPADRENWIAELETCLKYTAIPPWDGLMNWAQLAELVADGHEIGSHTLTHPLLVQCSDARLRRELHGSRSLLRDRLEVPADSFCYPNGDHDPRVIDAVARAGYRRAVSVHWGKNTRHAPPLTLRRCDIQGATTRSRQGQLSAARLSWRLSGFHPGLSRA